MPERAGRLQRAATIVCTRAIDRVYDLGHMVESECERGRFYWVMPVDGQMTCDCEDARLCGYPCKHGLAVELFQRCERAEALEASDPTAGEVIPFPCMPTIPTATASS